MKHKRNVMALLAVLAFALVFSCSDAASAQSRDDPPRKESGDDEINYDVELHLLVTGNEAEGAAKIPQTLDGVVRQLKASLMSADYKLAGTFIGRVHDGGNLSVKTLGGSPLAPTQQFDALTPAFFDFTMNGVKHVADPSGGQLVNIHDFRLGMKVPIQTATVSNDKSGQGYPVIQYEDTGINTQMSVREGVPTLVGTLNTSRPGQLFAIVITIKRDGK